MYDGAVFPVANPASSVAVQVPAPVGEVAADDDRITRASVHPSVVRRRRRCTTDYYTTYTVVQKSKPLFAVSLKVVQNEFGV